jgi:ATP-dependent protease HslVU (ClpYQ) peptidase subunit
MPRHRGAGRLIKFMSVIVVVKKAGRVVIASDTLYGFGDVKVSPTYIKQANKIHQCGDSFIGLVGASAHDGVLQHLIAHHRNKLSFKSKADIFDTYLRIHPILKEKYFINTSESEGDEYESSQINALIANSNGIFGMYSWREVYEFEKFWALGSGRDFALGALFTNYGSLDEPEQIAEIAVRAACEFDDGCDLPMMLHSVKLNITESKVSRQRKGKV